MYASVVKQQVLHSCIRRVHNKSNSERVLSMIQARRISGRFAVLQDFRRRHWISAIGNNQVRRFHGQNDGSKRVLIVGGGPTGLFLAHPFRLVEAQTPEQRFKHPQAHFLNTRTMEILKHGLSYKSNSSNPNHPNEVYTELKNAMPLVDEWMSFRFGPDMTSSYEAGTMIAEVIHPVDRPLAAGLDANGKLVPGNGGDKSVDEATIRNQGELPLSPESVGHLAQHKFCRILYDAVTKSPEKVADTVKGRPNNDNDCDILYGQRVTDFDWNKESGLWTIKTDQDEVFDDVDIVLAADGAASSVRQNLFTRNATTPSTNGDSTMLGTPNLQRLINVHFEIPAETTAALENQKKIPPAMLYTVFHPEVLAMVVRHGPGEYVLQIPYFEPYQTPEEDFSITKVQNIVRSIVGETDDFVIHSIRPWTMGSLVARNYYTDEGVFLVGDAAHVFPPAGGFGMNTGLQDAYSLAWRIAMGRQQKQHSKERLPNGNDKSNSLSSPSTMGRIYERERQPVARSNAALSVRNYQRVLNVMRACYLDDRHPALLIKALDATASFVPLQVRRQTFRTMLQTALSPLSQLQTSPNGIYSRTVKENLRELLGSGQGLPLLFPRNEIDFSYDESASLDGEDNETDHWSRDSVASFPRLAPGMLFPHIRACVPLGTLRNFPRLQPIEEEGGEDRFTCSSIDELPKAVSTRDLAAQLSSEQTPWAFCLLEVIVSTEDDVVDERISIQKKDLEDRFSIPFLMARLIVSDVDHLEQLNHQEEQNASICDMYVSTSQWKDLNLLSMTSEMSAFVVIRPDGHVAAISSTGLHADNLISGIQTSVK